MKHLIDFDECLRDSPKFREQLETEEASVDNLEQKLDKVLRTCSLMIEAGKSYVSQRSTFANALWDLSSHFADDNKVSDSMNRIIHAIQEMNKYHTILLDQASRTVVKNLSAFVKVDIKNVKDSKHHFEKISNDLDLALLRNSQVSRHKPTDIEEVMNMLSATRSCFRHTALDYVHTITMLQVRKRHEILATFLSYIQAFCTYYHQGADLTEDLDPFLKTIADDVTEMRTETKSLEKEMENRHSVVNSCDTALPSCQNHKDSDNMDGTLATPRHALKNNMPRMQGYLFKRTSNAFKTWNRRWFYLYDNKLVYRKRMGELNVTVMEEDLRLCTVKISNDNDRRFCFEVVSPSKNHMLQADSEDMLNSWVMSIQHGIRSAIQHQHTTHTSDNNDNIRRHTTVNKQRIWEQLLSIPGNSTCCDCSNPNPKWASINLGITLCIACSGVHRSLGVHYSKVRSLTLDDWEPDIVKVMAELGNEFVNRIYEAAADKTELIKPTSSCDNSTREKWIRAKYVDLQFATNTVSAPSTANARRWSVRKARRRKPRSKPSNNGLLCSILLELSQLDTSHGTQTFLDINNSVDGTSEVSERTESESDSVVMIGSELEPSETSIDLSLSSEHDSTEGEDDNIEFEDVSSLSPSSVLFMAARAHNIRVMCAALAARADIHMTHARQRTPLHAAALSGSVMACSYLLLNSSKLNIQDEDGKTPLHLATENGHTPQVCLFLRYRADQSIKDNDDKTPLDIAIETANADIVTLLRLIKLNDEMKASEMSNDATYTEVFRDYTHFANSHPERLIRNNVNNSEQEDETSN